MRRNKLKYTACLLLILSATACKKDFLDQVPDDRINIDGVFQKKVETEKYLYNVFGYQLDDFQQFWDANEGSPWVGASDEADMVWPRADYPTYAMNLGGWDASWGRYNHWRQYYRGIRSATYFLQRVDECKELLDPALGGSAALVTEYKAQARFLRALYYFYIIRTYGPAVLLDENEVIPSDAAIPDLQLPRNSFDECVDYIVKELDAVAAILPTTITNTKFYGRPTKGAALAAKARVLLYAASPLFNGNPDYASMKNENGKQLISQTADVNKWKKAADAAKAIIDMPQYSLYNQHSDPVKNYRYIFLDSWNSEVIYATISRNAGDEYWEYHAAPRQAGGWNGIAPTQQLVDAYSMDNGLPINDPASGYVETGFSTAATTYTDAGTWNMYVNREPRFYASILYNGANWINPNSGVGKIQLYSTGASGFKGSHDHSETGYLSLKMLHPDGNINQGLTVKHHFIQFRLGEMYLNYAEALNESNPGNPDILTYLNKIRQRAGVPDLPAGLSQAEMRERIRTERRIEMAFESHRYFDTRRWKIAEQTDGGDFWGLAVDKGTSFSDASFYTRTVFEKRAFSKKHYLFPIPQSEINIDRKLVQNTGW